MKTYNDTILPKVWEVYIKVDGVNLFCLGNKGMTREGTEYTLPFDVERKGHYELFREDWSSSISLLANLEAECKVDNLYSLDRRDPRLFLCYLQDPNHDSVEKLLAQVVSQGHEGLVLRQGSNAFKVKPFVTIDVRVTGIKWGTGRNKGKVGSLITPYGNVLLQKDVDKMRFSDGSVVGKIVEVKAMGWTKDNKMRHARFLRDRFDKDEENLERIEDKYDSSSIT